MFNNLKIRLWGGLNKSIFTGKYKLKVITSLIGSCYVGYCIKNNNHTIATLNNIAEVNKFVKCIMRFKKYYKPENKDNEFLVDNVIECICLTDYINTNHLYEHMNKYPSKEGTIFGHYYYDHIILRYCDDNLPNNSKYYIKGVYYTSKEENELSLSEKINFNDFVHLCDVTEPNYDLILLEDTYDGIKLLTECYMKLKGLYAHHNHKENKDPLEKLRNNLRVNYTNKRG